MLRHELPAVRQIGIVDLKQETGVDDGLVFFVHGVGDGEQIGLVVWVVVVFHPVLDGAGRDGGKKCFLVFLSLEARFEIIDFLLQPLLADILERPVAENSLDVVAAIVACSLVEVVAKLHHVAGENRRGPILRFHFPFDEAGEPFPRIAGKIRLADFAVVDDIEAAVELLFDDLRDHLVHPFGESSLITGCPLICAVCICFKSAGCGKRPRVGRQDTFTASLHLSSPFFMIRSYSTTGFGLQ